MFFTNLDTQLQISSYINYKVRNYFMLSHINNHFMKIKICNENTLVVFIFTLVFSIPLKFFNKISKHIWHKFPQFFAITHWFIWIRDCKIFQIIHLNITKEFFTMYYYSMHLFRTHSDHKSLPSESHHQKLFCNNKIIKIVMVIHCKYSHTLGNLN